MIIVLSLFVFIGLIVWIFAYYNGKVKKVLSAHDKKFMQLKAQGIVPEKVFKKPEIVPETGKKVWYNYLVFDFTHNLCAFDYQIFSMETIVEIQMINDATVVQSASSQIGGGALVGVIVPGVAGFGGKSQMNSGEKSSVIAIRVLLDDARMPSLMIPFLFGIADKASRDYQNAVTVAYEVYGIFEMAIKKNKQKEVAELTKCLECGATVHDDAKFCHICSAKIVRNDDNVREQLESLQKLRQSGILTEQEYSQKHAKLIEKGTNRLCKKCGKSLNPDQKFCPFCGAEKT